MIDEDSPKEARWQPRWWRSPARGRTRCPRLGREVFSVRACADATLVDPRVTTWLLSERDCYCQACKGTVHRNGINAGDSGMPIWHWSLRFRTSNSGWSSFVEVRGYRTKTWGQLRGNYGVVPGGFERFLSALTLQTILIIALKYTRLLPNNLLRIYS